MNLKEKIEVAQARDEERRLLKDRLYLHLGVGTGLFVLAGAHVIRISDLIVAEGSTPMGRYLFLGAVFLGFLGWGCSHFHRLAQELADRLKGVR